jgi:phospholipid/cholesterol/gamma-HCH transport system permease protein
MKKFLALKIKSSFNKKKILLNLRKLGHKTITMVKYIGSLGLLSGETLLFSIKKFTKREYLVNQLNKVGANSILIVFLITLFTGVVLALQSAYALQKFEAEVYIPGMVALSITRELGPVLVALIIAGRVGASMTAEIGTMKVTEQIDALRSLATDPIQHLVVPRFLALVIAVPLLTIYGDIIGMAGGYLVGVWKLNIGSTMYINLSKDALVYKDIFTGLIKSVFFAMIIAIVACYEGLQTKGGAEGVGRSTTLSVVISFILIIASDCFFTALFYFVLD